MDKYVKVRMIGEGSFGKALLVRRKDDSKQYVIKQINTSRMGSKEREYSRKEVRVLSQMKHPNIVAYLESFEERGNLYIVMDYCDGGDLYKKINDQRGRLVAEDMVLNWFVQICLGLKHVHDRKILHRDIKTQNIFLTKSGVIKLGDFGIARVLNSTMELARTCIGTPYYLSPEICENRPYNNKSDVWALGCVLYEIATLKHAFEAGNMKQLVLKIVRGSYPALPTKYSRDLRSLVDTCLRHHPRERPSVNAILRMPFIQKRIENFLSETVQAEEFSHTILHGHGARGRGIPGQALPPPALAIAGRQLPPQPLPHPPPKIKPPPAKKFHQPIAQEEKKKNVFVRPRPRPANVVAKKPISAGLIARKREAEQRAKLQEEHIKKQHDVEGKLQRQNYARRQSAARMNRAKQAAARSWRSTLSSGGEEKEGNKAPSISESEVKEDRKEPQMPSEHRGEERGPAGNQDMHSVQEQAHDAREKAVLASERARVMMEFQQRKREAAANKHRGVAQWMGAGYSPRPLPQKPTPEAGPIAPKQNIQRNKAEEEYLSRLQAIRQQNYQERKRIQQRHANNQDRKGGGQGGGALGPPPSGAPLQMDLDERKRKIAALKAQADQQAEAMRKKLEEKRQQRDAGFAAIAPPEEKAGQEVRRAWVEPVHKGEDKAGERRAWMEPVHKGEAREEKKAEERRAWMEPAHKGEEKAGEHGEQEVRRAWVEPGPNEVGGQQNREEVRKNWGQPASEMLAIAKQRDATGVIRDETSSNIVFEHPGAGEPAAAKDDETTPPSDPRKQWEGGEGDSLVAMLQGKTLQTGTYAVQKATTQNGAGETRIVFSKFADTATEGSGEPVTVLQDQDVAITSPKHVPEATSPSTGDSPSNPTTCTISSPTSTPTVESAAGEKSSPESSPKSMKSSGHTVDPSASPKGTTKSSPSAGPKITKSSPSASPKGTKSSPSASPKGTKSSTSATPTTKNAKVRKGKGSKSSATASPKGMKSSISTTPKDSKSNATLKSTKSSPPKPTLPDEVRSPPAAVKQAWTKDQSGLAAQGQDEGGENSAAQGRGDKELGGACDLTVEDIETSEASTTGSEEAVYQLTMDVFSTPEAPEQVPPSRVGVAADADTYHTPSAEEKIMMSVSLRAGTYDSRVNLLRTCSLPDLTSLAAADPELWEEPPKTGGTPKIEENLPKPFETGTSPPGGNIGQDEGGDSDPEPHNGDDVFYEDVAASEEGAEGGVSEEEEEGKEEGEEEEEGKEEGEEEEEWSSSEDEDLQQLVQTLQSFVDEAKSPVNAKSAPRTSGSPPPPLAEDWEDSDEDEEETGVLLQGSIGKDYPQDGSSVFNRLETTRTMLETELGLTTMLDAYQLVQTFYEGSPEAAPGAALSGGDLESNGDSARVFPTEELANIVGGEKPQLCKTLIHLVMADSVYVENTDHEVEDTDLALEESEPCLAMDSLETVVED